MGDLEGAPAVHFNFPLLSFSLYITFKSGLPLPVSLFLWNRGGLVNALDVHLFHSDGTVHSMSSTRMEEPPPENLLSCSRGGLVSAPQFSRLTKLFYNRLHRAC